MTDREPWMPSDEEIARYLPDRALYDGWGEEFDPSDLYEPIRSLIRAAVEKAVAEERSKHGNDTLRAKVETLDFAINAYEQEKKEVEARHARELERAKLEAKIQAVNDYGMDDMAATMALAMWRDELAALDKEEHDV